MSNPKVIFGDEPTGAAYWMGTFENGDSLGAREERLAAWLSDLKF